MKRRSFFAALCGLPALIIGRSTKGSIPDNGWQSMPAPINQWIWISEGEHVRIGRLWKDDVDSVGVWHYETGFGIDPVIPPTYWQPILGKPEAPHPTKKT